MNHAVIMAGGAGTRLWPLSRASRPKQLVRLFGGKSLLRHSFERLTSVVPAEQIHVITAEAHLPMIAEELPELAADNLIGEPIGRDTANAVGLAAAILHRRDPDGVMGVFTADHLISPVAAFAQAVESGFRAAIDAPDALVTFGVVPKSPETAYGYVRRGASVASGVYRVQEFAEKPNVERAEQYVACGEFYWNSGNFAWRIATILDELRRHLPESHAGLMRIADAWDGPDRGRIAGEIYGSLQKISIDYAVMERAESVLVVPMDCRWIDVGSWTQLAEVLASDPQGGQAGGPRSLHLDSRNVVVVSEDSRHLVATIGVEDLVVVHAPDATLICRREDAQRLRELVERIKSQYGDEYL